MVSRRLVASNGFSPYVRFHPRAAGEIPAFQAFVNFQSIRRKVIFVEKIKKENPEPDKDCDHEEGAHDNHLKG